MIVILDAGRLGQGWTEITQVTQVTQGHTGHTGHTGSHGVTVYWFKWRETEETKNQSEGAENRNTGCIRGQVYNNAPFIICNTLCNH